MDDSDIERIKNSISNDLSNINTDEFLSKLKNSPSVLECISISNEFIETFNEIKSKLISNISDELNQIKHVLEEKEISNNILQNEILISYSNIKNIINQNKLKIKNISSNINDIYTSVNLINSNLEKKKYSLASSRVSKIISIKNIFLSNIKLIETNHQKILEEIGQEKNKKLNSSSSNSTIKVRPAPTPFPVTNFFTLNNKTETYNKKKANISNKNNLINNTIETSAKKKIINKRRRDFSFSLRENTIDNDRNTSVNNTILRGYNTINNFYQKTNGNKNEEELNKKIINLKKVNENLKKEIEKLKEKINKIDFFNEQSLNNSTRNINLIIQNINIFKEKVNSVSDMLISLTFLFNKIQNKNKENNEDEKAFSDIKKCLLEITTEISELKSILLKISLENEDSSNQITLSSSGFIKSTNQSINFTEDLYTLTDNNNNIHNKETITQTKIDNNNINEISSLKEKLRISEKKLIELKSIYESDIESRNLIEKLLKQNLEENKISYEQKILKYKKKYEEKEKEIEIKNDNEENIQKLKNIYELKINNNKKIPFINLSEEKSINLIIINSMFNDNSSFEKEEYEKKFEQLEKEKKNLEILNEKEKMEHRENNNKNMNKILELENDILNYKNKQNELNEEIINIMRENEKKIKTSGQEIKISQEKNEELTKILNEYNEEIKKLKIEKEKIEKNFNEINNKLNKKDKEIITLITNNTKEKKNLVEQNKTEIEKLKKENNEHIKLNNNYKLQITQLQQKLSFIENSISLKAKNVSINKIFDFNFIQNNKITNINIIEKKEISLTIIPPVTISKKRSKNISNNNTDNSIEDSNDEEESEDFYDYENEANDEFIKKLKKMNKKNKSDSEEMKLYRKENRKMIYKLEDTLDEVDELKEKMVKIEKLVAEKQGQLYNSLKKYFGRILVDFNINLNNDNRENFIYFMKLIQYSDEEIKNIISSITSQNANNNIKKKIQFNFFK